ncbi:hypothetical protein V6N13_085192 [Hibiscus sabdariffa]
MLQVAKAADSLCSEFRAVDNLVACNSSRVLKAFQNTRVGSHHFAGCTGYGHDEAGGREAFEEIVGAESAIVRSQLAEDGGLDWEALTSALRPHTEILVCFFPQVPRNDTVQAVKLGNRELLLAFCEAVQRSSPSPRAASLQPKRFKLGALGRQRWSFGEVCRDKGGIFWKEEGWKRKIRVVLVMFNQGFGFNGGGGGGGKMNGDTARLLGNIALAVGLTYLSVTDQLGWVLDAIVSVWLIAVLVPVFGMGAFLWWAGHQDIVQSSCPNCGNDFQIFKSKRCGLRANIDGKALQNNSSRTRAKT